MPVKAISTEKTSGKRSASSGKSAYSRPSLSVFGSVRELTGNGTGGAADGGMFMA